MNKLPHWIKAWNGTCIAAQKMQKAIGTGFFDLSDPIFLHTVEIQNKILFSISALAKFNTRDYAYDFGGMTIDDVEMGDYDECEYINPDLL